MGKKKPGKASKAKAPLKRPAKAPHKPPAGLAARTPGKPRASPPKGRGKPPKAQKAPKGKPTAAPKPPESPTRGKRGAKRVKPHPPTRSGRLRDAGGQKPGVRKPDTPRRAAAPPKLWYVLSVEPGSDTRVRKAIARRKRIESMGKFIGRCYSPFEVVEKKLPKGGDEVASGKAVEPDQARAEANIRAWIISGAAEWEHDARVSPPGYRTRIFPARSQTKGKVGNGWEWVVRKERPDESRLVLIREKKFPGYLVIAVRMTTDAFHLVTSVKGVHYFLTADHLDPEHARIKCRECKLEDTVPADPPNPCRCPKCRRKLTLGEVVEYPLVVPKPIALPDREAAELLIQQSEGNKKLKDMKRKVELPYAVGDRVLATDGVWKNQHGTVVEIGGKESDPEVTVKFRVLGQDVDTRVNHYDLEKENS